MNYSDVDLMIQEEGFDVQILNDHKLRAYSNVSLG